MKFRHSASFGKRIEFWIIGEMLKEGLDVYIPMVDDMAIDAVVRQTNGNFIEVQIKGRSNNVKKGASALFAAIPHEARDNYWFVFYSERLSTKWIMTSEEFISESYQYKKGGNIGKRTIKFNGRKINKDSGKREEYIKPQFLKYVADNFSRLKGKSK